MEKRNDLSPIGGTLAGVIQRAATFSKFGPDDGVGLLAKHCPGQLAFGLSLQLAGSAGVHVSAPREALIEVLLIDANKFGKLPPAFGGNLL